MIPFFLEFQLAKTASFSDYLLVHVQQEKKQAILRASNRRFASGPDEDQTCEKYRANIRCTSKPLFCRSFFERVHSSSRGRTRGNTSILLHCDNHIVDNMNPVGPEWNLNYGFFIDRNYSLSSLWFGGFVALPLTHARALRLRVAFYNLNHYH